MPAIVSAPRNLLIAAVRRFHTSETTGLAGLAVLVGIGAGLGAVAFRWMIAAAMDGFFGGSARLLGFLGPYRVIPVPAAGGLIVGLLTYYLAREAKGHGVPEVVLAVATLGGRTARWTTGPRRLRPLPRGRPAPRCRPCIRD